MPEPMDPTVARDTAAAVGPCYTATGMARVLGWTESEVLEAGDHLRLLMLRTSGRMAGRGPAP